MAGAVYIEKHITLERESSGYNYYSALIPDEFVAMVEELKISNTIYGVKHHVAQKNWNISSYS